MVILLLGLLLIFAPEAAVSWFEMTDHSLNAGLSVRATILVYTSSGDSELVDSDDETMGPSAQALSSALTYFFVGLALALNIDPLI